MWLFQKPSTTKLVLNGVCGGGKQGRGSVLDKRGFVELSVRLQCEKICRWQGHTWFIQPASRIFLSPTAQRCNSSSIVTADLSINSLDVNPPLSSI